MKKGMKISRVLNTNAILSQDSNGEEVVLLGAGIGFKHRVGDNVELEKVEKRFVLNHKTYQTKFQELVNDIPSEFIMVAEQIISLGKSLYEMKLAESIHVSLADHIHTAVIHMREGIQIPNNMLFDIKRFYKNEYDVAKKGLLIIEEKLGCTLPEDEIGFIAMHFVNAQYGSENLNVTKVIRLVSEINDLILSELKITPDEDSLNYFRYMTHLKFFAQRVVENIHYSDESNSILDSILPKYQMEYRCCQKVCDYIYKNYNYKANHDEMLYLTAHLAHITHN